MHSSIVLPNTQMAHHNLKNGSNIFLKKYEIKRLQNLLFAPRSVIILTNAEIFHTQ